MTGIKLTKGAGAKGRKLNFTDFAIYGKTTSNELVSGGVVAPLFYLHYMEIVNLSWFEVQVTVVTCCLVTLRKQFQVS